MENIVKAGRWFFAIMLVGLAGQQCYDSGFRPVLVPSGPPPVFGQIVLVYLLSIALIVAAVMLVTEKMARTAMLLLGCLFLALTLFCHIPWHLMYDPNAGTIGAWNNALKELNFSGGAFIMAASFPADQDHHPAALAIGRPLERLIPLGPIFYSIMLIVFGTEHMLYAQYIQSLVPDWIPGHLFWTYFAGVILIGAGVGIILRIRLRSIALLLGIAVFIWFLILHIPRAAVAPVTDKGNELSSVFESLGVSGVAFVIAFAFPLRSWRRKPALA